MSALEPRGCADGGLRYVREMPTRLTVSLCEDDKGDVYVEARAKKQPLPVAALEKTHVQFSAVQESQTKLWLPEVKVSVPHLWNDSAAPMLGMSFEGAYGARFLDISRESAERRRLERLLEQEGFRVVWPVEGVEVSREQPDMRHWLPPRLAATEDVDAETWEEAVYTFTRDTAYSFGDRHKPGWKQRRRGRAAANVRGPISAPLIGDLPNEGRPSIVGLELPEGSRWPAGVSPYSPDAEDVLWCSDAAHTDAFRLAAALADVFPTTGLWPCLWDFPDQPGSYCLEELRALDAVKEVDPAVVLGELWDFPNPPAPRWVDPFTSGFPGLAAPTATGRPASPFALFAKHQQVQHSPQRKLVLVACQRPADVIGAIGFECGPEASPAASDVALSVSVLRSWEERFHAFLVQLVPGGLTLAVEAPPETLEQGVQVAAEVYAFAPPEDGGRPGALRDLARKLVRGSTEAQSSPHVWELGWPS
jgi:hypothetical protein